MKVLKYILDKNLQPPKICGPMRPHRPKAITVGRALAVVKVVFQVNGNSQIFGVCPPKNYRDNL